MSDKLVPRLGISLMELMAVLTIFGIIAVAILPRTTSHSTEGNREACFCNKGDIELQAQIWRRNNGSFPAADLSDIETNLDYFPAGLPTCPVDGSAYTIDTSTGTVTGHSH